MPYPKVLQRARSVEGVAKVMNLQLGIAITKKPFSLSLSKRMLRAFDKLSENDYGVR